MDTLPPEMLDAIDAAVTSKLKELESLAGERHDVMALHLLDAIRSATPRTRFQTALMYLLDAHLADLGEVAGAVASKPLVAMKVLLGGAL